MWYSLKSFRTGDTVTCELSDVASTVTALSVAAGFDDEAQLRADRAGLVLQDMLTVQYPHADLAMYLGLAVEETDAPIVDGEPAPQ